MKLLSSLSYSLLIYYKTHALFLGVRFFVKCVIINFKEVKYMRILIVEDEKDLSMILTEMLEMEGYYVDAAYDGVSGLDNALSGIYDIINSGYYAAWTEFRRFLKSGKIILIHLF